MADIKTCIDNALRDLKSNTQTELCKIMNLHKSDKGSGWHNYTVLYHHLLEPIRNEPLNVFEMGLGTTNINIKSNMGPNGRFGASLFGWEEYFPKAFVFGADIDADFSVTTDRIKTFYADQTSVESLQKLWSHPELENIGFDLIVDDGLHEFHAGKTMFENSFHKLNAGGIYIIEDIVNQEEMDYQSFVEEIKTMKGVKDAFVISLPNSMNQADNRLMFVFKS